MKWVAKSNRVGKFGSQPNGFVLLGSLENKFFICECPERPDSDFVVELPEIMTHPWEIYFFEDGQKGYIGVEALGIKRGEDIGDYKGRRHIIYTPEQLQIRLAMLKWTALNLFLPDKARMLNIDQAEVEKVADEIQSFDDCKALKSYIKTNLYYDC